jgi:hypothetical protein
VVAFLAAHARVFEALQTRATTEASHTVVGDVVAAVVAIVVVVVVVVVAAAVVEVMVVAVVASRRNNRLGVGCGINYVCENGIDQSGGDLTCVAVVKYECG